MYIQNYGLEVVGTIYTGCELRSRVDILNFQVFGILDIVYEIRCKI